MKKKKDKLVVSRCDWQIASISFVHSSKYIYPPHFCTIHAKVNVRQLQKLLNKQTICPENCEICNYFVNGQCVMPSLSIKFVYDAPPIDCLPF